MTGADGIPTVKCSPSVGGCLPRHNVLVVDSDQGSRRVLEVSLRKAGYSVTSSAGVGGAFEVLHANQPDLILTDTELSDMSGFDFVGRVLQSPSWSSIPLIMLSSDASIESRIRGLELGIEDYLTKPVYIREVIARVDIALERRTRQQFQRDSDRRTTFSGSLDEVSVADLLQTIRVSQKSGVLYASSSAVDEKAVVYFDTGRPVHAECGEIRGVDVLYRLFYWPHGSFNLEVRPTRAREQTIDAGLDHIVLEAMHRFDEWNRTTEQLPEHDVRLQRVLSAAMAESGDRDGSRTPEQAKVLSAFSDATSIRSAVFGTAGDPLRTLRTIAQLYFEGVLVSADGEALRPPSLHPLMPEVDPDELTPVSHIPLEMLLKETAAKQESPGTPSQRWRNRPSEMAVNVPSNTITPANGTANQVERKIKSRLGTKIGLLALNPVDDARQTSSVDGWESTVDGLKDDPDVAEAIDFVAENPHNWRLSIRTHRAMLRRFATRFRRCSSIRPVESPNVERNDPDSVDKWTTSASDPQVPIDYEDEYSDDGDEPEIEYDSVGTGDEVFGNVDASTSEFDSWSGSLQARRSARPTGLLWVLVAAAAVFAIFFFLSDTDTLSANDRISVDSVEALSRDGSLAPTATAETDEQVTHEPERTGDATVAHVQPAVERGESRAVLSAAERDGYRRLVDQAESASNRKEAEEAYRDALRIDPDGAQAQSGLALVLLNNGKADEALVYAEKSVQGDATDSRGWVTLGAIRQQTGDREGAMDAYRQCVKHGVGRFVSDCRAMLR
ncbi:MAG: response regulator [Polyangiales bacterium]